MTESANRSDTSNGEQLSESDALAQIPRRGPFLRALLVILFLSLVTYTLYERAAVLQVLEREARDFHARLLSPRQSTPLAIVRITADDYESLFDSTSPLDAGRLDDLLRAIATGRPRLIVVDLSTREPEFRSLSTIDSDVRVVWARESDTCESLGAGAAGCPEAHTVMTGFAAQDREDARYGLTNLERDADGVIRRYHRYFAVGDTLRPTLATAVMEAVHDTAPTLSEDPLFIKYRPLPPGVFFTASEMLEAARSPDFGQNGILKDQIVIVGGAYRAARDEHQTPLDMMFGVEVQAQVIQTELEGGGLEPVGLGVLGALLFFNSLGILFLFQLVRLRIAFWVSVAGIPLLATLCSLVFARSPFALWPYLIPLLIAVLIQQLYAHAIRYRNALITQLGGKVSPKIVEKGVTLE